MIKHILLLIILILLVFPVILQANEIEISQPTNISLVGGDSKSINLTVSYTGSNPATCTMSYSIPDGEGIDITYIPSTFTLNYNGAQKVIMIINTSLTLMPNIYTITTQVSAVSSKGTSHGKIKIITDPPEDQDDIPDDTDDTEPDDTQNTTDDDIIDDIIDDDITTESVTWGEYCLSIIVVIGAIITIMLLWIFRRRKEKNERK